MKNLLCYIFSHKWRYNFRTQPTKRICSRCHKKQKAKTGLLYGLIKVEMLDEFVDDDFEGETRSDQELINKWVEIK